MRFVTQNILTVTALALTSLAAQAAPTVLSSATHQLSLGAVSGCYQMGVAYDAAQNQYYGGGGGGPGCNGTVWNAAGAAIQNTQPINVDIRGVNYNTNNGKIEVVGYGSKNGFGSNMGYSGLYEMGRDGSGLYTGVNNQPLTQLSGMADDQSVAAYDSARDVFYSQAFGSAVNVASHATGDLLSTITLTGHSLSGVMAYAIGYDEVDDVLIEFDAANNDALVFDISGAFIGASHLSGSGYDGNYAMSYSNGMLFVGNGSNGGYEGFQILESGGTVPEPTSAALVLVALAAAGRGLRRRA